MFGWSSVGGQLRLPQEALAEALVVQERAVEELQRDGVRSVSARPVHLSHRSSRQERFDPESTDDCP